MLVCVHTHAHIPRHLLYTIDVVHKTLGREHNSILSGALTYKPTHTCLSRFGSEKKVTIVLTISRPRMAFALVTASVMTFTSRA